MKYVCMWCDYLFSERKTFLHDDVSSDVLKDYYNTLDICDIAGKAAMHLQASCATTSHKDMQVDIIAKKTTTQ